MRETTEFVPVAFDELTNVTGGRGGRGWCGPRGCGGGFGYAYEGHWQTASLPEPLPPPQRPPPGEVDVLATNGMSPEAAEAYGGGTAVA